MGKMRSSGFPKKFLNSCLSWSIYTALCKCLISSGQFQHEHTFKKCVKPTDKISLMIVTDLSLQHRLCIHFAFTRKIPGIVSETSLFSQPSRDIILS